MSINFFANGVATALQLQESCKIASYATCMIAQCMTAVIHGVDELSISLQKYVVISLC